MQNRDRALLLVVGALVGAVAAWLATSPDRSAELEDPARAASPLEEGGPEVTDVGGRDRGPEARTTRRHQVREKRDSGRVTTVEGELTTSDGRRMSVTFVAERRLTRTLTIADADEMWVSGHGGDLVVREPVFRPGHMELVYRLTGSEPSLVHWLPEGYARLPGTKLAASPTWFGEDLVFEQGQRLQRRVEGGVEAFGPLAGPKTEQRQPEALGETLFWVQDDFVVAWKTGEERPTAYGRGDDPVPGPELAWLAEGSLRTSLGVRSGDDPVLRAAWLDTGELSWLTDTDPAKLFVEHEAWTEAPRDSLYGQAAGWAVVPALDGTGLVFVDDDTRVDLRLSAGSQAVDPTMRLQEGRLHVAYGDGGKLVVLDVTEALTR